MTARVRPARLALLTLACAVLIGGCAASERQRPIQTSRVATSGNTLEATRKQLEGRWTLVSLEYAAPDGRKTAVEGTAGTLTATNGATVDARLDAMIVAAQTLYPTVDHPGARQCELIVKGNIAGEPHGWLMNSVSGAFLPDRAADPTRTDAQLRALASTAGQELTYTCVPPGSGVRMGIDRDLDGILDGIVYAGMVGIGFSLVVVGVAAMNLVLDFDFIERGAEVGAPKYMEWYGAFGLIVTLAWLYLELLRLLSKLQERR